MVYDLQESFKFYDPQGTGYISIPHFRNILHNFGFHRLQKREVDIDLGKCDNDFSKRNCVDLAFVKYVVGYRWVQKNAKEDEAKECFRVFQKKEDKTQVTMQEIKGILSEYVSANISDEDVKEFMREIDPNNNGVVQMRDFIKLYMS